MACFCAILYSFYCISSQSLQVRSNFILLQILSADVLDSFSFACQALGSRLCDELDYKSWSQVYKTGLHDIFRPNALPSYQANGRGTKRKNSELQYVPDKLRCVGEGTYKMAVDQRAPRYSHTNLSGMPLDETAGQAVHDSILRPAPEIDAFSNRTNTFGFRLSELQNTAGGSRTANLSAIAPDATWDNSIQSYAQQNALFIANHEENVVCQPSSLSKVGYGLDMQELGGQGLANCDYMNITTNACSPDFEQDLGFTGLR